MAAAAVQKTPAGPWTDYSRSLVAGEEVVGAIIDQILTDGGTALWQKYLERRAFGFASEVVAEAVVSKLKMCFVAHDQGEEDGDEVWELEDEPEPGEIDSWARMHMNVRRMPGAGDGAPAGAGGSNRARSLGNTVRSQQASSFRSMRSADTKTRTTARTPGRSERTEERAKRLEDEKDEDDEEKRLRDAKSQEEVRRRERAKRAREAEQQQEDDNKKVEALHEEMSRRPHTFDTEGNIIWVEEFKSDRLPKVQELASYSVKKDPKAKAMEERGLAGSSASAAGKQDSSANKDETAAPKNNSRRTRGRGEKGKVRVAQDLEFTDGYSKLQYGQPPILDTMNVQQGVVLEAMGKKKAGIPDATERHRMSRKEYNALAEQEMSMGGYPGAGMSSHAAEATQPSNTAAATAAAADGAGRQAGQGKGDGGPAAAAAAGKGAAAAATTAAPAGGGGAPGGGAAGVSASPAGGGRSLPPLVGGASQGRMTTSKSKDKSKDDPDAPPMQRAPPAPPRETRHMGKKMDALGALAFSRAPRYHHPALGGSSGTGTSQPPLGATMGHGLVRHGSLKEDYFFPPSMPDLALPLQRSTSETGLGGTHSRSQLMGSARLSSRGGNGVGPLAGTPKGGGGTPKGFPPGEAHHGQMRPESMSPAYRNFRNQLFPEPPATTAVGGGGGSNFGSRGNF